MKLLWKSLVVCLALLLGYNLVVIYLLPAGLRTGDSQWSDNLIQAQRFMYEEQDAAVVIVGSSLSRRLDATLLPHVSNLSFGGMSPQDGLRLLVRSNKAPKLVLVEANYLPLAERADFADGLFMPVLSPARRHVPALRDQNRPVSVTGTLLGLAARDAAERLGIVGRRSDTEQGAKRARGDRPEPGAGGDVFEKLLAAERQGHAQAVPAELLAAAEKNVAIFLRTLTERGSRVAFFQLPGHPDICDSPRIKSARDLVLMSFSEYPYVELGSCQSVTTTDGKHLDQDSARQITRELISRLDIFLEPPSLGAPIGAVPVTPASGH